ncbi:EamA family transporter RarD [Paracoccus aestuariivivens]|uniref:EamA family transporter RarD n=1 Tax=Paracoccus aestuariivivens TaxID=1820333 RepID=A0A6L6J353_9RHOB|nr:EamA family transporter RarD [Paracoccus aestuariivivens]MTH76522.1 EamA family transporter RarD [Paracoccus aestuariivivens]
MSEWSKGFWAMIVVCVTWGLSPLFYHMLSDVPVIEVLAHRTLWSLVFFVGILAAQGRLADFRQVLFGPYFLRLAFAALVISVNWGIFIWAVKVGYVVESSLGYYIFPLLAVVMGLVFFGEKLNAAQAVAVLIAALAVVLLTWGLGVAPWISLSLAFSFGLYGVTKKTLPVGPVLSVACEVAILAPLALGWLLLQKAQLMPDALTQPVVFGADAGQSMLLAASGIITAVPLVMFSYASRRVEMSTLGLMLYLNPTLQFLCAVMVFGENFTGWHMMAFAMIWAALAIYSASAVLKGRAELRRNA